MEGSSRAAEGVAEVVEGKELADGWGLFVLGGFWRVAVGARGRDRSVEAVGPVHVVI